ncbi:MAG: cadherin-like domain-containing protein [Deltaproteobacteria bacterium]|nr:cadherin-like domain-containing protein [Deltaproteobacteria bacterium]
MFMRTVLFVFALTATAHAVDPGPKKLPNGTGDGYADFATDAFGAFASSECGGGFNADGSPKAPGAAEFDPYNAVTNRAKGGLTCNVRIHIFSLDDDTPRVRQVFAQAPLTWQNGNPNYPDGTPVAPAIRPADLVADTWLGPNQSVRRTRFYPYLFPGLQVDLDQRASCATLTQVYRFTNTGATPVRFRLVQLSDTDLGFGSNFTNNWGRILTTDALTSYIYNNAKDVGLLMRARMDFDTSFEGRRVKVQSTAAWDFMRTTMYYGFPTGSAAHETPRCLANPSASGCPTPNHLNKIFRAPSTSGPNQYYIAPDGGAGLELDGDTDSDSWSDVKGDVAQSLQSVIVIPPGESREYRTHYEAIPAYCRIMTDAGFDKVVAVAAASACATTVTLDAGASTIEGGGASTYTWYDQYGTQVATGLSATVSVLGAGEHRFDLQVCNAAGTCDVDFVVVNATDPNGECLDTDGDGVIDTLDLDDDDDGIPDVDELATDSDGDGLIDQRDLDTDADHVPDLIEGDDNGHGHTSREYLDANGDGRIDLALKVDLNGNGWDDRFEADSPELPDFDNDGTPDVLDRDDDADQIPTSLECPNGRPCPANAAGQPDYLDVLRFACDDLYAVTSDASLGLGGTTLGTWSTDPNVLSAVARDGRTGHVYVIDATGALRRVTPGSEATLATTALIGVRALTFRPDGVLVAAVPAASTTTFYALTLAGALTTLDTVDGVVGDLAYDAAGRRFYTRVFGAANQLITPTATVALASPVSGLAFQSNGTLLGLTLVSGVLRVNVINPTSGALTSSFEPTRNWRPPVTPSAVFDLALCPPNLPPETAPDAVVTPFQSAVTVSPLANDSDADGVLVPATLTAGAPSVAGATVAAAAPGTFLVTPPAGFVGTFTFPYSVADDDGLSATGLVTVVVAPHAVADTATSTQCDPPSTLDLAANDTSHPDSVLALVAAPAWASLAGSTLTLAPDHRTFGSFELTYTNCYSAAGMTACHTASIAITIEALPCCGVPTDELVEQCDGYDDNCDGQTDEHYDLDCATPVYYAIVEDEDGVAVGTLRCFKLSGAVDCDRDPDHPDELMVYPALLCPDYARSF